MAAITVDRNSILTVLRALALFEAVLFLLAAAMHVGLRIPLGFAVLGFPATILPAAIAETLIGLGFVAAAVPLFSRSGGGLPVLVAAHVFALLGVLIGLAVGPQSGPDRVVHYVMLGTIIAGLALIGSPPGSAALSRGHSGTSLQES